MVLPLLILLGFQLAGEVASRGLGLPLPGPVAGLVGLLLACRLWPRLADRLRPVTTTLLGHLSLFFVPAGVGVVAHGPLLARDGVALAVAIVGSTVLALLAGAWTFTAVARLTGSRDDG